MSKKRSFKFAIEGKNKKGENIKPSNFDIGKLKSFLNDIEQLVTGSIKNRPPITIEYKEGSALIAATTDAYVFNSFQADFERVKKSGLIEEVDPKRAEIIQKWQDVVKKADGAMQFNIVSSDEDEFEIVLSKDTNYNIPKDLWVESEVYVYGKITDLGGKVNANIHLDTEEYGLLKIDCDIPDLASEKENRLYKNVGIKVAAKQNIATNEIRDYKFQEFIDYSPELSRTALDHFIELGTKIWANIDPVDWVRNLRGGYN